MAAEFDVNRLWLLPTPTQPGAKHFLTTGIHSKDTAPSLAGGVVVVVDSELGIEGLTRLREANDDLADRVGSESVLVTLVAYLQRRFEDGLPQLQLAVVLAADI